MQKLKISPIDYPAILHYFRKHITADLIMKRHTSEKLNGISAGTVLKEEQASLPFLNWEKGMSSTHSKTVGISK